MNLNWREEAEYSFTAELKPFGWAWQFIRRSKRYRAAWQEKQEADAAWKANPGDPYYSERQVRASLAAWEFGLAGLVDPDEQHSLMLWSPAAMVFAPPPTIDFTGSWPGYPHTISLTFTFHRPLALQLQLAAQFLEERGRRVFEETGIRAKPIRLDAKRFTRYLRLLDARDAQISIGEIGRLFFSGKQDPRGSAKAALRAARRMTEEGYRDLLLTADP